MSPGSPRQECLRGTLATSWGDGEQGPVKSRWCRVGRAGRHLGCSQPRTQHGALISSVTRGPLGKRGGPTLRPALRGAGGQLCAGQWALQAVGPAPPSGLPLAWTGWGGRVPFPRTPLGGGSPLARRVTVVHVVLGAQPLSVTQCRGDGHLCVMSVSSASSWGVCWGGGGPTNTAVLTFCEADELGSQIPLALRCGGFLP